MQKMVLLPYDRYQRLVSSNQDTRDEKVNESNEMNPMTTIDVKKPEANTGDPTTDNEFSTDKLISLFPKSLQSRARALITYVRPFINWNSKGEVIVSGETIQGSNIVDLIKVQLKDYKNFRPTGLLEFEAILTNINVPHSLLSASRRQQIGGSVLPPPPGTPVKRKHEESGENTQTRTTKARKFKWLRL